MCICIIIIIIIIAHLLNTGPLSDRVDLGVWPRDVFTEGSTTEVAVASPRELFIGVGLLPGTLSRGRALAREETRWMKFCGLPRDVGHFKAPRGLTRLARAEFSGAVWQRSNKYRFIARQMRFYLVIRSTAAATVRNPFCSNTDFETEIYI